jgi:SAM-dependent methyltransferase
MLGAAQQRVTIEGLSNVDFRLGTALTARFDEGEIDLCIASLVLHHEPVPADALARMHSVVKPGGKLLVIEQQAHKNQAFFDLMQDRWWGFEPEELAEQVRTAGFTDVQVRPLITANPSSNQAPAAPALFVLTGTR